MIRFAAPVAVVAMLCSPPARCADLELHFNALERLVAEQLFTQDGRRYVKGTPAAKCQYAYLEAPHFTAVGEGSNGSDGARLKITAKFSGRSAMDVFGRCMGLGDSFDVTILAAPVARQGVIAMDNVRVTTVKDSYYIRRVRQALGETFGKDFKIDIRDQAKKLLGQSNENSAFTRKLDNLDLNEVRVMPDALVLVVEFKLVVK